jgi:energy-coupling factor transport system substrate-specific component
MTSSHAVRVRMHTWLVLLIGSLAGLAMFMWPLLTSPPAGTAHSAEAPFIFVLILPLVIAVVLAEMSSGGLDVKAIAMLGLLSGVGAALRPLGAGTAGLETVFFLLILAGRVYGPGFGFVLGSTTMFASAFLTGGVGPWLPFQMIAASWVGLGAGLLPRYRSHAEIAILAFYGAVSAYVFGFLVNMWFWPYSIGTFVGTGADPGLQFVPGDAVTGNLRRFFGFTLATSTLGWDTGRAITNVVVICTLGAPVLAALRRARRRVDFYPDVAFEPPVQPAHRSATHPPGVSANTPPVFSVQPHAR